MLAVVVIGRPWSTMGGRASKAARKQKAQHRDEPLDLVPDDVLEVHGLCDMRIAHVSYSIFATPELKFGGSRLKGKYCCANEPSSLKFVLKSCS